MLFSFQPFKAPGPDGLHPIFFRRFWENVKHSVFHIIFFVFDSATIPAALNETYLTLIPKVDNVDSIHQYRPISLCNTTYKILSKVIVNRIKPFLQNLISPM